MRKRLIKAVASILLVLYPLSGFANTGIYPLKSEFPNGIKKVDSSLFSNSKIIKPLETDFEEREEIELLIKDELSKELSISEDSYSGKFSLKIKKTGNDIIPVCETEYFKTGNKLSDDEEISDNTDTENISGIRIIKNDKVVTVSGNTETNQQVTILVEKGETIAYIGQKATNKKGDYSFTFPLEEYGTYNLGVGFSQMDAIFGSFELSPSDSTHGGNSEQIKPIKENKAKCNFCTLMLKPMYNSEEISFYMKVKISNGNGEIKEEYALIKSDSDGDGIFSVGEDLSRGKWQSVQLKLTDLDEEFQSGVAAGLYIKANQGSEWLIDSISSDYKKINEAEFNLEDFSSGNVIYTGEVLRFANNDSKSEYNIGSRVVSGEIETSEKISSIQIGSRLQYGAENSTGQYEKKEILYSVPLETGNCVINSGCEKVQKPKMHEELPAVPKAKSMSVSINSPTETKFRLLLRNSYSSSRSITVQDESENSKTYSIASRKYTDWYEGDIVITSSYNLSEFLKIEAIEYETEEGATQDIILGANGNFTVDLGEFTTNDRTTLSYEVRHEYPDSVTGEFLLEFFESDAENPYYSTKTPFSIDIVKQTFNNILPKIRANTKLKITNSIEDASDVKLRFSSLRFSKLAESDWNKLSSYVNRELIERNIYLKAQTSGFESRSVKRICTENEKYAVVYPDAIGVVNISEKNATWEEEKSEYDTAIYRIINLSNEPAEALIYTSVGSSITRGTPICLDYGIADYVVKDNDYLVLPPNQDVMLIGKNSYSEVSRSAIPLYYTYVDGLYNETFVKEENSIIYSNVYDKGCAYRYDAELKTSEKLTEDTFLCASPDGTHLLLKNDAGKYYILNLLTNQRETTPITGSYRKLFFNVKNELFIIDTKLSYYSMGKVYALDSGIDSETYYSYAFDSTGEYLLWAKDEKAYLYKNTNGIWNKVSSFDGVRNPVNAALSNDISTAYIENASGKISTIDLTSYTVSSLFGGKINEITEDNMILYTAGNYCYLYNPVTGEKYKLFNEDFECQSITYNPKTNMVTAIVPNSSVIFQRFTDEEPEVKYALSFDGRNSWYSYNGGRWQIISQKTVPSGEELRISGMTASAVNSIPSSAFDKLYGNNTDVLTVDVALYMYSDAKNRTPVIESITVETIEKNEADGLYGVHIEKYKKDDYRKIESLFPVENFDSGAECYYLLYIGNEWLYTYKNNELVKLNESADSILEDISESWITFKQYGMDAQQLRRVPGDVLTNLFVNEDFANTEFGVIYVVKTKNENTENYTVNFRLGSSSDYINNEDIVIEITMNGGDVKVIDSRDFSLTDIENLLSWIEARQSGNGEIFYRLKNEKTQYFINYYMINSISVYSGEEYREEETVTAETEEE